MLAKNETATQTLRLLYEQKESIIKNLITFTADTADKKLYADKADFADCYPFIPYQFNLLGQVLTAVRTHGASGKHLSDQSRSMLALFQESAIRVMNKEEGVLVPFSFFYDPLHKFIDHQHSQVISDAENNSKLDEFDVELLKVLFMIKYVKEIKANVDNLTTLMISNIDDDRIEVRSKIEESLKKLIKETLVQKNGEIYIFLTNEEQEINNAINNESVEMGEIIGEASTVIFEEIYTEKKYRYNSRYLFPFNQKVDDRFFKGNQSNDIGVTVITPYGGDYADSALRLLSAQESSVIVKLPNDSTFLDEITESIKIYKFLNKNASGARGNFDSIRRANEDERIEKNDRIRIFIEDALKNADIYVNGDKATISAKEPVTRINEALGKLVAMKYNKLTYMETALELSDISAIFKHSDGQMSFLGTSDTTPNKLALEEVVQVIGLNNARHMKTSLKSLQDKFGAAPYGFDPKDVQWLVAMLFKLGRVSLTLNSQSLSLLSSLTVSKICKILYCIFKNLSLISLKEIKYRCSIFCIIKQVIPLLIYCLEKLCRVIDIKDFCKSLSCLFHQLLTRIFRIDSILYKDVIVYFNFILCPVLEAAHDFVIIITGYSKSEIILHNFFCRTNLSVRCSFSDVYQEFLYILSLCNISDQFLRIHYVSDQELLKVVEEIETIVKDSKPFGKIQRLPELNKKFGELHIGFKDAREYGSILNVDACAWDVLVRFVDDLDTTGQISFESVGSDETQEQLKKLIRVAQNLGQKYDAVVTNPPYMGAAGMSAKLSDFVKKNYPYSKSDMSTVCMERTIAMCKQNGYMAMINIPVWMFLTSYEKLRDIILQNNSITSMIHPGRGIFGSDFGTIAFTISKRKVYGYRGCYRRLFSKQGEVESPEVRKQRFLECRGTFEANQEDYFKIPGHPISYWVNKDLLTAFINGKKLGEIADSKQGLATADNNRFLRLWYEVDIDKVTFSCKNEEESSSGLYKWYPYNKGGEFRKWYGNNDYIVNWEYNGREIRNFTDDKGKLRSRPQNTQFYFKECFSWSLVTSSVAAFRYKPMGHIFDVAGMSCFSQTNLLYLLALCNTKIVMKILEIIAPTINYQCGDIANIKERCGEEKR